MKAALTFFTLLTLVAQVYCQQTQEILDSYIVIKDALISGNKEQAARGSAALEKLIAASEFSEKESIIKEAKKISRTPDLEKQRIAFAELSILLWKEVKDAKDLKTDVFYQYCPMKDSYWISNEKSIKNPYYGSKMLNCGKVVEEKIK